MPNSRLLLIESISAAADDEIDRWHPGACAWDRMRRALERSLEG
jgi:hypothetical protein